MNMSALLENMYPVSALSRGKAASVMAAAQTGTPAVILKNNAPYRIITTTEEYAYLSELEEDAVLLALALSRLSGSEETVSQDELFAEFRISEDDLNAIPDVDIA